MESGNRIIGLISQDIKYLSCISLKGKTNQAMQNQLGEFFKPRHKDIQKLKKIVDARDNEIQELGKLVKALKKEIDELEKNRQRLYTIHNNERVKFWGRVNEVCELVQKFFMSIKVEEDTHVLILPGNVQSLIDSCTSILDNLKVETRVI